MFNLDKFISDSVTFRPESMFKCQWGQIQWQIMVHGSW